MNTGARMIAEIFRLRAKVREQKHRIAWLEKMAEIAPTKETPAAPALAPIDISPEPCAAHGDPGCDCDK